MLKKIAIGVGVVVFAVPVFASAAAVTGNTDQIVAIYQQIIILLQKQLAILQGAGTKATLGLSTSSGKVPLTVDFTVANRSDTEAVDFGDGNSTGSDGCKTNTKGHCDLSAGFSHVYAHPGTYTVTLYNQLVSGKPEVVSTATVTVTK